MNYDFFAQRHLSTKFNYEICTPRWTEALLSPIQKKVYIYVLPFALNNSLFYDPIFIMNILE